MFLVVAWMLLGCSGWLLGCFFFKLVVRMCGWVVTGVFLTGY